MNEIKYVQLEPSAFLSDVDFQMMDAEQRGVFVSIIFYLYCNGGKLELNQDITLLSGSSNRLAIISGCAKTGADWDTVWSKIGHKFQISGNILTHKRVTEELKKAENYIKTRSKAGVKGMQSRWGDNTDITKESKVKESKVKELFNKARKLYPGTKRGLDTEFNYFRKTHKDWREVLPLLLPVIERQIQYRKTAQGFVPEWKHLKTWIYNRCWEEIPNVGTRKSITTSPPVHQAACAIDRKPARTYRISDKGERIDLCGDCDKAARFMGSHTNRRISISELERRIEKGKAKLQERTDQKPKDKEMAAADKKQKALVAMDNLKQNFGKT